MKIGIAAWMCVWLACLWGCAAKGSADAVPADAPGVAEEADAAAPKETADASGVAEEADAAAPKETADAPGVVEEANAAAPQNTADAAVQQAEALAAEGRYGEALRVIETAEIAHGRMAVLEEAFERIYDAAPTYNATPRKVGEDEISAVKKLGGGSTLVYRLIKDKKTYAAFKPRQTRKQSNPRSEIAAYRFCPLMRCRFDVPVNLPVWFTYRQFSGLYARLPSNPADELRELEVVHVEAEDRVEGTQKAWIAEYALFPIEMEDWWKALFEKPKAVLQAAPATAMLEDERLAKHPDGVKIAARLEKHFGTMTQYDLALQISNLLVFDFLLNNWDRYSGTRAFWGVNCQFSHGRFMSIDNGAALSQTPHPKPERHLRGIRRFSRLTYEAIGALDHDRTLARLYPNATDQEKDRFETFWKQRGKYLNYIQSLVAEYGETEVLFFD